MLDDSVLPINDQQQNRNHKGENQVKINYIFYHWVTPVLKPCNAGKLWKEFANRYRVDQNCVIIFATVASLTLFSLNERNL